MNTTILNNLLPVLLLFLTGYLLKSLKVLKLSDGQSLLRLVFNLSLPALIITAISGINIKAEFAILPIVSAIIIFITYLVSSIYIKKSKISTQQKGVFLIATMIMNTGFVLPFVISAYSNEGLARATIFDLSNGILTFTFTYYLALKYGKEKNSRGANIKKIVLSAPIWAIVLAFFLNIANIKINTVIADFLDLSGRLTVPLIMISIGVYFSYKIVLPKQIVVALLIRMIFGFMLGFIICSLIDFDEVSRKVILICSSAPVGYNTMVFSSIAKLDTRFASSLVSCSIVLGIIIAGLVIIFPI